MWNIHLMLAEAREQDLRREDPRPSMGRAGSTALAATRAPARPTQQGSEDRLSRQRPRDTDTV